MTFAVDFNVDKSKACPFAISFRNNHKKYCYETCLF